MLLGRQRDSLDELLFMAEERTWHMCVAVFHEHPSLIDEATRQRWRRVEPSEAKAVGEAVAARTAPMNAPRLDSLCVCADGALIAGFVDDERGCAAALREACARAGGDALGELTSRPKRLLHVTLGRLLGRAEGLRPEQAAAIAAAVRAFHATPLREQIGTDDDELQAFSFALRSVALMRDSVWWMTRCEEFKSWELAEG